MQFLKISYIQIQIIIRTEDKNSPNIPQFLVRCLMYILASDLLEKYNKDIFEARYLGLNPHLNHLFLLRFRGNYRIGYKTLSRINKEIKVKF